MYSMAIVIELPVDSVADEVDAAVGFALGWCLCSTIK